MNSRLQFKAEVLDIYNSEDEWGLRKPLVNLLYSSILLAKLLEHKNDYSRFYLLIYKLQKLLNN
jgi:hypothetical protein